MCAQCCIYGAVGVCAPVLCFSMVDGHKFSDTRPNKRSDFEPAPDNLPGVERSGLLELLVLVLTRGETKNVFLLLSPIFFFCLLH